MSVDLSIVSSTGPLHSGKSFLLNRLIGVKNGFSLGYTVDPMTRGLWAWSEPLQPNSQSDKHVLFMDTEGFAGDANALYDSKVFGVTSLLSSAMLYNSVKMIDQSAIDTVEMLARQTQLFAHRAKANYERNNRTSCTNRQSNKDQIDQCIHESRLMFPHLVWVAQDFTQDLMKQSADEWLLSLLSRPHHRETHVVNDDRARASITDMFASVHCRTLFLPHTSRETLQHLDRVTESELTTEYKQDLQALKQLVFSNQLLTNKGTGKHLVHLLRWLVEMVNLQNEMGVFPEAPSSWTAFVELQSVLALDSAYDTYRDSIDELLSIDRKQVSRMSSASATTMDGTSETLPPPSVYPASMTLSEQMEEEPSPAEFINLKKSSKEAALSSLRDMLTGWDAAYRKAATQLKSRIATINNAYDEHYAKRVDRLLRQLLREQVKAYSQEMDDWHVAHPLVPDLPATKHHINTLASIIEQWDVNSLKFTDWSGRAESRKRLEDECKRIGMQYLSEAADRVNAHLAAELSQVTQAAATAFKPSKPLNDEDLKALIGSLMKEHMLAFGMNVDRSLHKEKGYTDAVASLSRRLRELSSNLASKNEQLVLHACKAAMNKASSLAERRINALRLPMAEQPMHEASDALISTVINEQFRPANEEVFRLRNTTACQHEINVVSDAIAGTIEMRNVKALQAVFTTPLNRAAKRMKSLADTYWFPFSFRRGATSVALSELHEHVEKVSAYSHLDLHGPLVSKMIEKFIETDLSAEVHRINSVYWRTIYLVIATVLAVVFGTHHLKNRPRVTSSQ